MLDRNFPAKILTYLLDMIAGGVIASNDAIFVRELGYPIAAIRILRIVDDNPGITFVEICESSGLERSLTSRILQRLITDRLLMRRSSAKDARRHPLATTAKGKALRQRSCALSDRLEALLLAQFPLGERAQLFDQIERMGLWVRSDGYRQALARLGAAPPDQAGRTGQGMD